MRGLPRAASRCRKNPSIRSGDFFAGHGWITVRAQAVDVQKQF
jgi:hypothetical protein